MRELRFSFGCINRVGFKKKGKVSNKTIRIPEGWHVVAISGIRFWYYKDKNAPEKDYWDVLWA